MKRENIPADVPKRRLWEKNAVSNGGVSEIGRHYCHVHYFVLNFRLTLQPPSSG
jgi:hypothetical protein